MANTKAQVGDLIRVLKVDDAEGHYAANYTAGDILEVTSTHAKGEVDSDEACVKTECGAILYAHEYVIHRKAGEEDSEKLCEKCASFAGTDDEGSFCSRECIERMQRNHVPAQSDAVNSPQHYTQGKFEVIDVIEQFTSGYNDGFTAHCVGTATKYIARAPYKHDTPLEDLQKAARYLAFAIEHEQRKIDASK